MSQQLMQAARVAAQVTAGVAIALASSYAINRIVASLQEGADSSRSDATANANRKRLLQLLTSRGRSLADAQRLASLKPTKHELAVLSEVVFPDELHTTFADIGGHHRLKRDLYESIILPLQNPALFRSMHQASTLLAMPGGILFYGPPGTGKTLMARSIAAASGATFINVRPSTMQSKWFGESQKLVRAIFSVAQQYAPSIIFIDECDSFMRKRGAFNEHEANATMKSEFLSLWDGLLSRNAASRDGDSAPPSSVMVLACTNRPFDIDEAFLRRMPRSFLLPLPSESERIDILKLLLREQSLGHDSQERESLLTKLGKLTENYSGSDLKELCRVAAALPVRQLLQQHTRTHFENVMHGGPISSETEGAAAAAAAAASTDASTSKRKKSKKSSSKRRSRNGAGAQESDNHTDEESNNPWAKVEKPAEDAAAAAGTAAPASNASIAAAAVAAVSGAAAAAAAASTSASSASAPPAVPLGKPRPLQLSDFKHALKAVRPSGTASMRELLAFEQKHRGVSDLAATGGRLSEDEEEEEEDDDTDEGTRASEQDDDDDAIYK